ncbi:MAG: hypothetical protein UFA98_12280 [Ruminococcus sp.]|nr:hypothetical protein [Ruminococcus sp.]
MHSDLQKISKDLIIYSALASDFEPLDFKNDALAGVRANYFNSGNMPQSEKTELMLGSNPLSLSYSMKSGEPLSWKAIYNNQPYQTVKRETNGNYCVLSYNSSGNIYKRLYFDADHNWLRTEYYGAENSASPKAAIYPRRSDGIMLLMYKEYGETKKISTLFPSLKPSGRKCGALVYSNSGMIWYDTSFKPSDYSETVQPEKKGFNFTPEDFTHDIYGKVSSKLDNAPYLTADDIPKDEVEEPKVKEPEPVKYSAYDKIASILFEAHKTNKNIFGELANEGKTPEPEEKAEEKAEPQPEQNKEETTEAALEKAKEKIEEVEKENDGNVDAAALEMVEAFGGNPDYDHSAAVPVHPDYKPAAEEKPDKVIEAKSGSYLYYGALDENNRRTGRGRTVSEKGLTSYEGDYVDDKRQGFGICYYKEGSVNYVGTWNNGSRDGAGVGYRLSDGIMHAGGWSNNAPSGFGARFDRDGSFLDVCTYVNGKRNGKSISFDEDGNIVVRLWSNGEMISEKIIAD